MKLVGSWKLEIGVDKRDVREREKKKIVKHERRIVIILTFEFEHISRLLFKPLFFYFKNKPIDFEYEVF